MFPNIWQRGHVVEFLIEYIGCLALFVSSQKKKKNRNLHLYSGCQRPILIKNVVYSFLFHMFPEVFKIYL